LAQSHVTSHQKSVFNFIFNNLRSSKIFSPSASAKIGKFLLYLKLQDFLLRKEISLRRAMMGLRRSFSKGIVDHHGRNRSSNRRPAQQNCCALKNQQAGLSLHRIRLPSRDAAS